MLVIQDVVKLVKPDHVEVAIFLLTFVKNGPIAKLEEKRMDARYLLRSPYEIAVQSWNDCPEYFL